MSVEEEIELKDLIAQTLKSNGTLAKIKAQLRASIFLALDEDEKISKQKPLLNNKIKGFMESDEAVYEPESYIDSNYKSEEKQRLLEQFGLGNIGENKEPVLYQLLKIAKQSKKNLEVNININGNMLQENKPESIHNESESVSDSENICSDNSEEERIGICLKPKNGLPEPSLNATFDVQSPMYSNVKKYNDSNSISAQNNENSIYLDHTRNKKQSDDTSSLVEDVDVELATQNSSSKVPERKVNGIEETEILKDKLKMSPPKSEKLKSKSNFSSLSDLPPLNKSRVSDILPSLYNKDFKDKSSNLRELDKCFDMDAEFEEDFMYSGDDLSLKSDHNSVSLLEELQQSNKSNKENTVLGKKDMKPKNHNRIIVDCKFKTPINTQKNKLAIESLEMNGENEESTSEGV